MLMNLFVSKQRLKMKMLIILHLIYIVYLLCINDSDIMFDIPKYS